MSHDFSGDWIIRDSVSGQYYAGDDLSDFTWMYSACVILTHEEAGEVLKQFPNMTLTLIHIPGSK